MEISAEQGEFKRGTEEPFAALQSEAMVSSETVISKAGWAGVLTTISNGEFNEKVVLAPVIRCFSGHKSLVSKLERHHQDEARHGLLLREIVQKQFSGFEHKPTLITKVLYQFVVPLVASFGRWNPVFNIALLYFFEAFTNRFYVRVKERSGELGLTEIEELLTSIIRDELRHIRHVEIYRQAWVAKREQTVWRYFDRLGFWLARRAFLWDCELDPSSHRNARLKRNLSLIGVDLDQFQQDVLIAEKTVIERFSV
ncbi:MAG: ferritin-like domain-containing protein [Pseudomonadota bacterium]